MPKNEMMFGRWLIQKLTKRYGVMVTRLESHYTANGIPDLFVCGNGSDVFIELKTDNNLTVSDTKIKVKWRPGQQAWALDYAINHLYRKNTVTLISVQDGLILVPHDVLYKEDTVYNPIYLDTTDVNTYNLLRWIYMHSYIPFCGTVKTYLDLLNDLHDDIYIGMWGKDVDAPPSTVISEQVLQEQVQWTSARYHELVQIYYELCEEVALNI